MLIMNSAADSNEPSCPTSDTSGLLQFEENDEEAEKLLRHIPATQPSSSAAPGHNFSFDSIEPGNHYSSSRPIRAAVACIYASHALARWAWRMWEFAVVLILMKLRPTSLLLVSTYGLLDNLTRFLLGPFVGTYIDRTPRLTGAVVCYSIQNICIAVSAASAGLLVLLKGQLQERLIDWVYWTLLSITIAAGAFSSVGSVGAAVSVEREYPKVLCGSDTAALAKVNSVMRAIDLSAQMLAPVAAGFVMTYASMLVAIIVMAVYCMAVWPLQVLLLHAAHRRSHLLREAKHAQHAAPARAHPLLVLLGWQGWAVYFQQSTLLPAVALALLYFTVLSLGFLMTSYLAWSGLAESTLSLFRGAGALSGLSATLIFQPLQRYLGLSLTGFSGITWQLLCLLAGVVPIAVAHLRQWPAAADAVAASSPMQTGRKLSAVQDVKAALALISASKRSLAAAAAEISSSNGTSHQDALPAAGIAHGTPTGLLYVLLSGLVASRMGLWLFDLAVTQFQQLYVPAHQLGTVSGVQVSFQSFFEIGSFVAGCIAHKPEQFHWLMFGSCCTVAVAAVLYTAFMCKGLSVAVDECTERVEAVH